VPGDTQVRVLCHTSKGDLSMSARMKTGQVVLAMGDYCSGPAPWVGLAQPGMHLYLQGFNVVFVDVPSFNQGDYLKHGSELMMKIIQQMGLPHPHVLSRGLGGAVFLQALTKDPDVFGDTHFVYNIEYPRGHGVLYDPDTVHKTFSGESKQLWLTYDISSQIERKWMRAAHMCNRVFWTARGTCASSAKQ